MLTDIPENCRSLHLAGFSPRISPGPHRGNEEEAENSSCIVQAAGGNGTLLKSTQICLEEHYLKEQDS